ncbi:MAG: hypothetical protein ACREUO_09050, partial [Burkholderiales bacterium]
MKTSKRLLIALAVPAFALSGCYVIPVTPDGQLWPPLAPSAPPHAGPTGAPLPAVLNARLYPSNEIAARTGILTGTVTNMMTGKGRFQLNYQGETLTGEATRVSNDERRGVASAFGSGGTSMSCEYQMNDPRQGAGTCT